MSAQSFKQRLLSGSLVLGLAMSGIAVLAPGEAHAGVRQAELYSEALSFTGSTAADVRSAADQRCLRRAHAEGYDTGVLVQTQTDVPNILSMLNHPSQVF